MSIVTSNYFTNYSSVCLKVDSFDRDINVLLYKGDFPREMAVVTQDVT